MLFPGGIKLNLTATKPADIPDEEALIKAGKELMQETSKWKHLKDFEKMKGVVVKGYTAPKAEDDEQPWFCRASEHDPNAITFEEMWFALGTKKPEHEQKFVHDINHTKCLKELSPRAKIWALHYKFKPPISDRIFTVLQIASLELDVPTEKTGIIVSIPIDVTPDEELHKVESEFKGTKGRYVAVEMLRQLENGNTEWRMATSSTPGGAIPNFVAQSSIPGQVANDVPLFLKWVNSERKYIKEGGDSVAAHIGALRAAQSK